MENLKKRKHDKKLDLQKKVIIIAEIGLNHNGDLELAKKVDSRS
jgi:sialic acid synthase SpsE